MSHIGLNFLGYAGLLWWVALVLAIIVGLWAYFRLLAPLGAAHRALLRTLRIAAFGLLLLMLLEPVLSLQRSQGDAPHLAVLVDRSSSMALPGAVAATRREEAALALSRLEQALSGRFRLDLHTFAGDVTAAGGLALRGGQGDTQRDEADLRSPHGATAIGDAIEEILVRQSAAGLGGILLLSDGTHTAGKDPALVARNLSIPVFTVRLGDTLPPADLMIRQVKSHPLAYAGEPVGLRVVVEHSGNASQDATLRVRRLRFEGSRIERGAPIAERAITLGGSYGEQEIPIEITPGGSGILLYEVELEGAEPEAVTINNRRLVTVEVREKKTRLLYLEGEPDWDFTFLRRVFDADTTLAYAYLVRQADGDFVAYGQDPPESLPRSAGELAPYAAIIIGRLPPQAVPDETRAALEAFVSSGGGVLFLDAPTEGGGIEAWQQAGWGRWLPVVVAPERRRGFALTATRLSLAGLTHEVTNLGDSPVESEELWLRLPPVWVREGRYAASPGATVLLTGETLQPPQEIPVLCLAPPGGARVAVLTARGFWRWDFVMRSVSEGAALAPEFWRRMARWIAEPVSRERIVVRPLRRVFQDGEAIAFSGKLSDEAFAPVGDAQIRVRIEALAGLSRPGEVGASAGPAEITLYPDGSPGGYAGRLASLPPGMYRYQAEAVRGHGALRRDWRDEGCFWIEPMGAEFLQLASSPRTLEALARASGGYAGSLQELDDLIEHMPQQLRRGQLVSHLELWNHWLLFAFLVTLLSIEWVVRRRKGLA